MAKNRVRVQIAKNDDGSPIYQWVQADNQNELNDRIVAAYIKCGRIWEFMNRPSVEAAAKRKPTFGEYAQKWLTVYKVPTLKHTTLSMYRSMLSVHLLPAFGDRLIDTISPEDIQIFLNERKDLSKSTLTALKRFLGAIFKDAAEDGLMEDDPTNRRRIVIPSRKELVRQALPFESYKTILAELPKLREDDRRMMALMMLTGMRRGEMLGLRWEDIELETGLIHVRRNVTYAGNQPHIGTPKTAKGERDIPVHALLVQLLAPMQESGFIIGGDEPITEMSYNRRMERIEKAIDLHGATAHIFRHSYLTYAAGTGMDVKTLQSIAGHADIQITMNRYVHPQTDKIVEAGRRMDGLFAS